MPALLPLNFFSLLSRFSRCSSIACIILSEVLMLCVCVLFADPRRGSSKSHVFSFSVDSVTVRLILSTLCTHFYVVNHPRQLRSLLVASPAWSQLINALHGVLSCQNPSLSLQSSILISLVHSVSRATILETGLSTQFNIIQDAIISLRSAPTHVGLLTDVLIGLAQCPGPICVEKTFPLIMSSMDAVMASVDDASYVSGLLVLCLTLAESHLPLVDLQGSHTLLRLCVDVVRHVSVPVASLLASGNVHSIDHGSRDISNLLALLHQFTAKDFFDIGPDSSADVGVEAAFAGMCALLSAMSADTLIHFPDICTGIYDLLSSLIITAPGNV
uniref:Uncharacterized protein n=1 Tax=Spongospora subterranea TaxID=70186 RepID=A0A0H5QJ90_9EUKA|eukprot:CRZ02073.1 hypothetical protein [Spongospora subterranea]